MSIILNNSFGVSDCCEIKSVNSIITIDNEDGSTSTQYLYLVLNDYKNIRQLYF